MTKYWTPYIILVVSLLIVGFEIMAFVNLYLSEVKDPTFEEFRAEAFTFIYHSLLVGSVVLLLLKNKLAILTFLSLAVYQIGAKTYGLVIFIRKSRELGAGDDFLVAFGILVFVVAFYSIPIFLCLRLKNKGYFKNA